MTAMKPAAVVWLVSGALWFVLEGVAAAGFAGYSYATNYISDLGVPVPDVVDGRVLDSRLAVVMNVEFLAHGILFVLAALLAARAARGIGRWVFLALAVAHGAGLLLVGAYPSSSAAQLDGTIGLHVLGANLAIVGGNLALIAAGAAAGRLGAGRAFRIATMAWGAIGLLCALGFLLDGQSADPAIPVGVWERAAVYPLMLWEIVTGALLLRRVRV